MSAELAAHQEQVRAAVCDGLAEMPVLSEADLEALRVRLVEELRPIAAVLSSEVVVDAFAVARVAECPASFGRDPFRWTAPHAARSLGLRALRAMTSLSRLGVLAAVDVAVDDAIREDCSVGRWLAGQDGPGRGATVAAAVSWASRAWVAVPWRRLGTLNVATSGSMAWPLGRGRLVALRGRPDAVIQTEWGRRDDARQVMVRLGAPSRSTSGLDALALTVLRGRPPLRAVTVQPSSGLVAAVDVDGDLLRDAVDDVVATAATIATGATIGASAGGQAHGAVDTGPAPPPEHPGAHCLYCIRRDRCVTGGVWMRAQPRRVDGIPLAGAAVR